MRRIARVAGCLLLLSVGAVRRFRLCAIVIAASCMCVLFGAVAQASPITITFAPLVGPTGTAYTGHVESGFTVRTVGGAWFQALDDGNPTPDIYSGPIGSPAGSAEITVSRGGELFNLVSVDAFFTGTISGAELRFFGHTPENLQYLNTIAYQSITQFDTYSFNAPSVAFDWIEIIVVAGSGTTAVNLDNIVLNTTPVPDPGSTLLLLGMSLAGLRAWKKRLG